MTAPFEPHDMERLATWLGVGDGDTLPVVNAGRVYCDSEWAWLTARGNGIGASEVGVLMGLSSWTSPYALWYRKKLDWRLPTTEGQVWGHLVEDPIAELFAAQMSAELFMAKPLGHPYSLWQHPIQTWAMCTPDRLGVTPAGHVVPVELKSDEGGDGWGLPGTDEVPPQYRTQALWQAFVFGAPGTYVVRKRASGKQRVVWYWVPFDGMVVADMLQAAWDFLGSIERNEPPDPDGSLATTETLQALHSPDAASFRRIDEVLWRAWQQARADKREATERDRLLSNQVRAAMGDAKFATTVTGDGFDVIRVKRRVGKRGGYTVAATTVDELRAVGDGQRPEDAGLRPEQSVDSGAAASDAEEGFGGSGPAAAGVGDGAAEQAPAADTGGDAVTRSCGVTLPLEIKALVDNALDDIAGRRGTQDTDRGCET